MEAQEQLICIGCLSNPSWRNARPWDYFFVSPIYFNFSPGKDNTHWNFTLGKQRLVLFLILSDSFFAFVWRCVPFNLGVTWTASLSYLRGRVIFLLRQVDHASEKVEIHCFNISLKFIDLFALDENTFKEKLRKYLQHRPSEINCKYHGHVLSHYECRKL